MENSKIEWTNHTFNPWHGCMKISDGCKFCYAEIQDHRYNKEDPHWGLNSPRKPMSDEHWKKPYKWNKEAAKAGVNAMVFCASMADVFEADDTLRHVPSRNMVYDARLRLMQMIATTPNLTWQLLTKRPDNILPALESLYAVLEMHDIFTVSEGGNKEHLEAHREGYLMLRKWVSGNPPANVWLGTSVENQKEADNRILALLNVPAVIHFLSMEPLLGPVDLFDISYNYSGLPSGANVLTNFDHYLGHKGMFKNTIKWVIVGGESGNFARPMHPDWVRQLRNQCEASKVPFFFKQWGDNLPDCQAWPEAKERPIQFPSPNNPNKMNTYYRPGKYVSGSKLDKIEYKGFPVI